MKFSEKLRRLRKDRKLTQAAMAEMLEISPRAYQNYEEGKTYPKDSLIYQKLASFFDVSVDFLISQRDDDEEDNAFSGDRGRIEAMRIIDAAEALYAGGTLTAEDEEAFHRHMMRIYERAKERRTRIDSKC